MAPPSRTHQNEYRQRLRALVEHPKFQWFITAVILVNAATLGLETSRSAQRAAGVLLAVLDHLALGIFVLELLAKMVAHGRRFFRDGWNLFDFTIVAISVVPFAGNLSVLRALRILRVVRLLSVLPRLRAVVEALLEAIPGMASIVAVLLLLFYVASVLATQLFGENFPAWFGTIGRSMYSLFQIMTLESWSMGIVRPVMEKHPWAWAFFVPFIVVTSFAVLNLFIGILVNAIQARHEADMKRQLAGQQQVAQDERREIVLLLQDLSAQVASLRGALSDPRDHPRPVDSPRGSGHTNA